MHLRALTPLDAPAFVALRLRGLRECPEAFASSAEEEVDRPLAQVEVCLQPDPASIVVGAFDRETLCAIAGLQREAMRKLSHKAYLWGVYVAPEARGRGVGAALLQFVLDHAADVMGVRQVNLGVNTRNLAALALYEKLGFKSYGLERDFLQMDGVLHDEHQMVCPVTGPQRPWRVGD
ncbi:MAG: hypothetical protein AD742_01155 [Methylibium sp. NZG]|nr:MAG: hypothetical protein AD742_01155 [Methylibium sp. NZG]